MNFSLTQIAADDLMIGHLSKKEQEEIITELGEIIFKRVTLELLEMMPDDKLSEFEKLSEGGDAKKLETFLDEVIPTHKEITEKATQEEIKLFTDAMKEVSVSKLNLNNPF